MSGKNRRDVLAMLGGTTPAGVVVGRAPDDYSTSRRKTQERHFPNVELTTHEGKKVHFYDDLIKDKIVVINFMYAKCEGICMPITMNLKEWP